MQKNGTARFMNTSNTRIGEDGHNYLLLRNKRLVSYYDNFVYIWDLHNKLLINTIDISIHKFGIEALAVYDNYIITGGFSSELKVWDYESKRCLYTFLDHSSQITDLKLIGCHLFSASSDNLIIKWDIKSIIQSEAFTPNVSRAKWDNKIVFWNSCKICANFESGYLELLDANSCLIRNLFYIGQQQKSITFCLYEDILYFDIFAFIDCKNSILVKYDLNTNISKKVQHESLFSNMLCFNDILLLSGWLDGKMTIKNGELDTLAIKTFHEGGILNVSQNDYFIATIAMDNKVRLWNKKDFSLFEEFDGWGAVYLCNKFLIFSTLKNELKFYLYNEILKSFEHNKSVNTNQKNIKEIIEYKELILTYDENSIIFWNHQLNRLSSKIFDMKIVDIILKDDILTIDHGLYKDKEIFKLEYLYS